MCVGFKFYIANKIAVTQKSTDPKYLKLWCGRQITADVQKQTSNETLILNCFLKHFHHGQKFKLLQSMFFMFSLIRNRPSELHRVTKISDTLLFA